MPMETTTLFKKQASQYAKFRPGYPEELFAFVASHSPTLERAWDCATGSGQAAQTLARYFNEVIATDISSEQISHATSLPNVKYRVASAEKSGIESKSVDALIVATALHWFDHDYFFLEAKRVLKPKGVFAAWTYCGGGVTPEIDSILGPFEHDVLRTYWSDRIQLSKPGGY